MNAKATNTEPVEVVFNKDAVVAMVAALAMVAVVAVVPMVVVVTLLAAAAVILDTLDFNTNSSLVCNT